MIERINQMMNRTEIEKERKEVRNFWPKGKR